MRLKAVPFLVALLPLLCSSQQTGAKAGNGLTWKRVAELPEQFRGRWAQADATDKIDARACEKDGVKSADLFVGPSWFLHATGQGQLTNIEQAGDEEAHYEVVDNGGNEIGVTLEIMTLSENNSRLEIGSDPEIGWEITHYKRCPDHA